jgi:hypothetical protein
MLDHSFTLQAVMELQKSVAQLAIKNEHVTKSTDGHGTKIDDMRDRLARLETRVDHLPGKGFIATVAIGIIALIAALVTLQQHIQTFLGIAQHHH